MELNEIESSKVFSCSVDLQEASKLSVAMTKSKTVSQAVNHLASLTSSKRKRFKRVSHEAVIGSEYKLVRRHVLALLLEMIVASNLQIAKR